MSWCILTHTKVNSFWATNIAWRFWGGRFCHIFQLRLAGNQLECITKFTTEILHLQWTHFDIESEIFLKKALKHIYIAGQRNVNNLLKIRQILNYFFKPTFLPKNERTNSSLLLVDFFSFVFWKKVKTPKRHFEINWPLVLYIEMIHF